MDMSKKKITKKKVEEAIQKKWQEKTAGKAAIRKMKKFSFWTKNNEEACHGSWRPWENVLGSRQYQQKC